ncbi:glutathione S-transferase N-terminal domain-containing protein [Sneathiella glossodoripedis]|uniref:glutathione S-transferase N-terminal domain-containing protein n=1 Tax=Sneathiella glossodoripedis TaxID=418853 RepID=UPI000472344D|nr:glutathione S-transferase N-terminal domain-containing protein [Sneathiella glossodoripedis]
MSMQGMQLLKGSPASPYTRKMTALLRYRHIPYRLLLTEADELQTLPKPKVPLLPTFYFEDENGKLDAAVDSTPLIRRFEKSITGKSVIPNDPVIEFLDFLLEDFADEWLTKAMFHYRWYYSDDIEKAGNVLPRWRNIKPADDDQLLQLKQEFSNRQISRLYVVGSNEVTAPVIEGSYKRYIKALNAHLQNFAFLFGRRPAAADFAAYGQLTQLAKFDPTPAKLTEKMAPRVYAWVDMVDDLSGLTVSEDDWLSGNEVPPTLLEILKEVGRGYVPVMLANAKALLAGQKTVEAEVEGKAWVQDPFPYQGKCLQWIREKFESLSEQDQKRVSAILEETRCRDLLG